MAFKKNGDAQRLGITSLPSDEVVRADATEILGQLRGRNLTAEEADEIKRAADAAARTARNLK